MARTLIKFCGLTRPEDAAVAGELGVDAVGVVLRADSPRRVEEARAREVLGAAGDGIARVGLFVGTPHDEVREVAARVGLDRVQLHGPAALRDGPVDGLPTVLAVRSRAELLAGRAMWADGAAWGGWLLDPSEGKGRAASWSELPADTWLAGGLTETTLAEALAAAKPLGVDVSSGIEAGVRGEKDAARMRAFAAAVRRWDAGHDGGG